MIYVSTACIQKKKISDILQNYYEVGIRNIELSGGTSYYTEIEQDLREYKERYQLNYACHSYFPPPEHDFVVNLASCNDAIYRQSLEHYKNCIELLKRIECGTLSIHAGFYIEIAPKDIGGNLSADIIYDKDKATDRFCSAYEIINRKCRDNDIRLYLENNVISQQNYESFGNRNLLMLTDFEDYKELNRQLDFNLLLDLGHLHVSANTLNKDYKEECMNFAPFTQWIHISENDGFFDQHKPLCEKGEVLQYYRMYFDKEFPVTLETNGCIEEVLNSLFLLGGECHE